MTCCLIFQVIAGSLNSDKLEQENSSSQRVLSESVFFYPSYSNKWAEHDIAVIKVSFLRSTVPFRRKRFGVRKETHTYKIIEFKWWMVTFNTRSVVKRILSSYYGRMIVLVLTTLLGMRAYLVVSSWWYYNEKVALQYVLYEKQVLDIYLISALMGHNS